MGLHIPILPLPTLNLALIRTPSTPLSPTSWIERKGTVGLHFWIEQFNLVRYSLIYANRIRLDLGNGLQLLTWFGNLWKYNKLTYRHSRRLDLESFLAPWCCMCLFDEMICYLFTFIMKFTRKRLSPCFAFLCFRMVEPGGGGDYWLYYHIMYKVLSCILSYYILGFRLFPCFAFSCFRMVEPGGGDYGKKCKRLEGKTNITGFSRIPACSQHSLTIKRKLFLFCLYQMMIKWLRRRSKWWKKVDGDDADDDD